MDRTPKVHRAYKDYLKRRDPSTTVCTFCEPEYDGNKIVADYTHCYVMANTYPYSFWELRKVTEHLMIVPRRHVTSLSQLHPEENEELISLFGKYEQDGYDIFARTSISSTRSQHHQHTHLIKSGSKRARGVFFWRKPYILKLFR